MTTHPLVHPWRSARVAVVSLALTAAALTSAAGSAPAAATSAAAAGGTAPAVAAAPCLTKASHDRVRVGISLEGSDPNDLTLAQTQRAQATLVAKAAQRRLNLRRITLPSTRIDVYVHVIERSSGSGGVSKSRIKKQIAVLNKSYAGLTSSSSTRTGFSFALKKIDKTKNSDWYHWSYTSDDDLHAKTALHRGGPADLNLYVTGLQGGLLGYSTFPWETSPVQDGVVVLNASLPGGNAKGYNKGDTATHEVGHWLGLLHTFENGCTSPGDLVDDTPYQADGDNVFSCAATLDTCPSEGLDPVHNFMSYGDDGCLNRFTAGQAQRMATAWQLFRAPAAVG